MSPRSWGRRHFLYSVGSGALTLAVGDVAWAAGVEGSPHPRPGRGPSAGALRTVRIGCVLPTGETGGRGIDDGILLGREEAEQVGALLGVDLEVLVEHAGGQEGVEAAVTRLLDAGVQGLVGGVEAPASREAGRMAAWEGIPFVDALPWGDASSSATDSPCSPASFRVGVDPATGLGLVVEALSLEAPSGLLILVGDLLDPHVAWGGEALARLGWDRRILDAGDSAEALSDTIRVLSRGRGPGSARVLLVGPTALSWAFQPAAAGSGLPVFATTPVPSGPLLPVVPVHAPALWHPDLVRFGASQVNERHERRFGAPMDSSAWAGWFAVKLLWEVVLREGGEQGGDLPARRLAHPTTRFDGHKGVGLGFRSDGLLRQPLYLVRMEPDGGSEVVHEGPAAPGGTPFTAAFDSLGPPGTPCRSGRVDPARPTPSAP